MFGRKATRAALERFGGKGFRAANQATVDLSEEILNRVVDSIRGGTKTGKIYFRENPTRTHQASAEGQAPADDTGVLANSYYVFYQKVNQYVFSATVGSSLFYAVQLELGDGRTAPRPHLEPAIREVAQLAGGVLVDAWKTA
jgi:hypothetical protein